MTTYTYSRWDGSQDWSDMDEDDFLQALSDDILTHGDVNRALRNLFQRGMERRAGRARRGAARDDGAAAQAAPDAARAL